MKNDFKWKRNQCSGPMRAKQMYWTSEFCYYSKRQDWKGGIYNNNGWSTSRVIPKNQALSRAYWPLVSLSKAYNLGMQVSWPPNLTSQKAHPSTQTSNLVTTKCLGFFIQEPKPQCANPCIQRFNSWYQLGVSAKSYLGSCPFRL